jgi:hypothetical protein
MAGLANITLLTGNIELALSRFEKVLDLDPHNFLALLGTGQCFMLVVGVSFRCVRVTERE